MVIDLKQGALVDKKPTHEEILQLMPNIFRLCYRIVKDKSHAQDAAHETFLALASHNKSDQIENLNLYASQVAVNICINILKREKTRKHLPIYEQDAVSNQIGPIDSAINNESIELMSNSIDKLQEEYRIVISLRYLQELDYESISKILGKSQEAVRVTLHRALEKLREHFKGAKNE